MPQYIFAHELATDKTIGAILHVDPDDDPIVGQQAGFFFEFKDKKGRFDPQNCDCVFSVSENGKEVYSQALFQNTDKPSLSNASVFYTFPTRDVYEVKVMGKPINGSSFQAFILSWDWRVSRIENSNPRGSAEQNWWIRDLPQIGIISIIVILFIILYNKSTSIKKRR